MSVANASLPQRSRRKPPPYIIKRYCLALLFVLPALINFAVFRYYPMIWAARASLWDYSLLGGFRRYVGLDNYKRALTDDPFFMESLKVTLQFALAYVPLVVVLALALAVFASQPHRGMGLIRGFIFIPVVTSYIVVSIVWGMILNKDVGLLNSMLQSLGLPRQQFLTSMQNALPSIIGITVWKDVGYGMIILVAGLRGISQDYYEAAQLDGANAWQKFKDITVPLLRRHLVFVTVISTLFAFQVFVPVYQLTQGGPGTATNVAVFYIYQRAFRFGEMGYASALSVILLLILLVVSVLQLRLQRED